MCDASEEAAAEVATVAAEVAAAAEMATVEVAAETSSKEAVAWAVTTCSEPCSGRALLCLPTTLSQNGYWYKLESC